MSKYFSYYIELLQDLKLAKTVNQPEYEQTISYITGSSIRGAYISSYISKYNISNINEGVHKEKLLQGGVKFLNAYPVYNKTERSVPFPTCFFAPKDEINNFINGRKSSLEIIPCIGEGLCENFEKVKGIEFVRSYKGNYKCIKVDKVMNLHINKRDEVNRLFSYEAIKKGQVFKGIIKVEKNEYENEIIELLENQILYVGGSKGSGYGKCRVTKVEVMEENPEYKQFVNCYDFDDEIYLVALSDIIYRNDIGQYSTYIDEEFIKNNLELDNVEFTGSSIETVDVTAFNNKWNCCMPQIRAIKAGSVFKYKISGEVKLELLKKFMDKGIGERRQDGFGRFVILSKLEETYIETYYKCEKEKFKISDIKLTDDNKSEVEKILTSIFRNRAESLISKEVLKMYKFIKNPDSMDRSQWGNLMDLFRQLQFRNSEEGIAFFNSTMDHLYHKRSKSFDQFKRIKYNGEEFGNFLRRIVNSSSDFTKFKRETGLSEIFISDLKSKPDKEFIYRINMKILEELCRYHLRKEDSQ